jgi:hypothetical protein
MTISKVLKKVEFHEIECCKKLSLHHFFKNLILNSNRRKSSLTISAIYNSKILHIPEIINGLFSI